MVLLLFVSVSAPSWGSIYFLKVHAADAVTPEQRFGIFGYCLTGGGGCSSATFGYPLTLQGLGDRCVREEAWRRFTCGSITNGFTAGGLISFPSLPFTSPFQPKLWQHSAAQPNESVDRPSHRRPPLPHRNDLGRRASFFSPSYSLAHN
jgi:hypothetical protein